jgi:hypothetical protein
MNQGQSENNVNSSDVAPNPFLAGGGPDQGAIPTIPGFDMGVAKKAPINSHGILTLGILVLAAGAIWGMRFIGLKGQTGVMAQEVSSTWALDTGNRPPAVMTVEDKRLLADLSASRTQNQVPGDDLQKNPFSLSSAARPRPKATPGSPVSPTATKEEIAAARQRDLLAHLEDYKLQGVMGGTNAVARINGKAYRVGDTLGGDKSDKNADKQGPKFVVTAVEGREVTLAAEGFSFILSMDGQ